MVESYLAEFPGYYKTADAGYVDADGYVYVMGRTDDIITSRATGFPPAASRRCCPATRDVAECAVLGIKDELKGEVPAASSY
jgi:propionyl-CoA synthetase